MVSCPHPHSGEAISPFCFGFYSPQQWKPLTLTHLSTLKVGGLHFHLVLLGSIWCHRGVRMARHPETWMFPNSMNPSNLSAYNEKTVSSPLNLGQLGFAGLPEQRHLFELICFLCLGAWVPGCLPFHPRPHVQVPLAFLLWPFIHGRWKIRFKLLSASSFHSQYCKHTSMN